MTEARITINPRIKPLADELMQLTGVNSLSNLFALLLTRYGYHLKSTWVITASIQQSIPMQPASVRPSMPELPHCCETPQELSQTEDPVILRIAGLIENF